MCLIRPTCPAEASPRKRIRPITCRPLRAALLLALAITCPHPTRAATRAPLRDDAGTRVQRFLFPLPQECAIGEQAFSFPAGECVLLAGRELNEREQQFLADFNARWEKRVGTRLSPKPGKNLQLRIVVGRNGANRALARAARKGLLDLKQLAGCANPEQAYAVTCAKTRTGATVYLAANAEPGLYYALGTLEQIVTALSKPGIVTIPELRILDWPDIPLRGIWGAGRHQSGAPMSEELARFSSFKLNLWDKRAMKIRIRKDGTFHYPSMKELLREAARRNVRMIPQINHLSHYFHSRWHSDLYKIKDQLTADEGIEGHGKAWCWHKPESQNVLHRMLLLSAEIDGIDNLVVWLSEGAKEVCHCPHCKGDAKTNFINETKNILEAYRKVKREHPRFKLAIMTTQGSYPFNDEIFKLIPSDVGIVFYGGSGPGNTYHNEDGPLLAGYPTEALIEKGHTLGALPLIAASHLPGVGLFPFNTPSLLKQRMAEMHARHISQIYAWAPYDIFMHDVNTQAEAEYAWHVDGRSLKEFAVSWATRNGYADPEAVGQIMNLLDEPSRALCNGINSNWFKPGLNRMADLLLGEKPEWGTYHDLLKGVNKDAKAQHVRELLDKCEQALHIARELDDKEFIAGSLLMTQWMRLLQEYAVFGESARDATARQEAKMEIARLGRTLPQLWLDWVAFQDIPRTRKKTIAERVSGTIMKPLERLGEMPDAKTLAAGWVGE